jgi:hypothetical protein
VSIDAVDALDCALNVAEDLLCLLTIWWSHARQIRHREYADSIAWPHSSAITISGALRRRSHAA